MPNSSTPAVITDEGGEPPSFALGTLLYELGIEPFDEYEQEDGEP